MREILGKARVVECKSDSDLRDTEQVLLLDEGRIDVFIRCEVMPCTLGAWIKDGATKFGCEINFIRHLDKPKPLRTLEVVGNDILALGQESEGLLREILGSAYA